jgi:DNA-binding GntR family transcriptional regulator
MGSASRDGGSSKQQTVYEAVRERIVAGRYGPGYRLVLSTLAREFGVSSLPLREALRRLEAEGWLTYIPNVGASVERVDPRAIEQAMHSLALLEGYATALAAPHLESDDLDRLAETNARMRSLLPAPDPLEFGRLNRDFHGRIVERCPNEHVRELVVRVGERLDAMRRSLFVHLPRRFEESVDEHEALLALLVAGAPVGEIEQAAREHRLRAADCVLELSQRLERAAGRTTDVRTGAARS